MVLDTKTTDAPGAEQKWKAYEVTCVSTKAYGQRTVTVHARCASEAEKAIAGQHTRVVDVERTLRSTLETLGAMLDVSGCQFTAAELEGVCADALEEARDALRYYTDECESESDFLPEIEYNTTR